MKMFIWNIRGIWKSASVRQLRELVAQEHVDVVGIQETIKQSFSSNEPESLAPDGMLCCNWLPSRGHLGGILMGVKEYCLQVENWEQAEFYVGPTVRHLLLNFRCDIFVVYGQANHEFSLDFLQELRHICQGAMCQGAMLAILIGGTSISLDLSMTKAQVWEMTD